MWVYDSKVFPATEIEEALCQVKRYRTLKRCDLEDDCIYKDEQINPTHYFISSTSVGHRRK